VLYPFLFSLYEKSSKKSPQLGEPVSFVLKYFPNFDISTIDAVPKRIVPISKHLNYGNRVEQNIIGNSASRRQAVFSNDANCG
jgi:hypothetical protein